jgi:MATE family multidrug resistance protein
MLRLALPLVISTASWTVMNFTDRMFLLWYSTEAMAAAMPAGMFYFAALCFPFGVCTYVTAFVAQYHGAGRPERIGLAVWQGVRIALVSVPLLLATSALAPWVFSLSGHTPAVAGLEATYYQVLTLGGGGVLLSATFSSLFIGLGKTRVVMLIDTAGALLNVVLDYAWIFGRWGFPEMGIAGAALATSVSQWVQVGLYAWVMRRPELREHCQLTAGRRGDPELMRRLLRYGGPNGLQMLVEVAAFAVFLLLVGRLGTEAMVATTLALNINSVAFVPMLGVGLAVTTMVARQLGGRRPDRAARAAWTGLWIAEIYMGSIAVFYVATPDLFLFGHAQGTNPAEFARLRDVTVVLLRFVAAYSVFDALNVIFVGAIKGAGDTRFILLTTTLMSPPPVLAAWWGMTVQGWGVIWCWAVLTAWVCGLGLIYLARFLQGRWRRMVVIEPDVLADGET